MENPKIRAALIGGVSAGILSALPYIQMLNALCCALFIGGGVLATYLYFKNQPPSAKRPYGEGALIGLLAGVFSAIAGTIVGMAVMASGAGAGDAAQAAQAMAQLEDAGIELPDWVRSMGSGEITATAIGVSLVFNLILSGIFSTIGGLVGVAIFHQQDDTADD